MAQCVCVRWRVRGGAEARGAEGGCGRQRAGGGEPNLGDVDEIGKRVVALVDERLGEVREVVLGEKRLERLVD